MNLKTPLCDKLGVEYPIMLAGMGGVSYAELVAAVSNAGGFGTLGAVSLSIKQLRDEMRKIKDLTDKPFGVDLLTPIPGALPQAVDVIIKEGAKAFVAGLGVPTEIIRDLKEAGVLVIQVCGTSHHALKGEEAGVDIVIGQGTEGGGHTGLVATMVLVPQMVETVSIPVVAAGGIADGRGLAAALALGAQGVWIGTRFIATKEANAAPDYKQAIVDASENDTVVTRSYSGKPMRVIKNEWTNQWESRPQEIQKFPEQIMISSNRGVMKPLFGDLSSYNRLFDVTAAGQCVGAIRDIPHASEVVKNIMSEAKQTIRRLADIADGRFQSIIV